MGPEPYAGRPSQAPCRFIIADCAILQPKLAIRSLPGDGGASFGAMTASGNPDIAGRAVILRIAPQDPDNQCTSIVILVPADR